MCRCRLSLFQLIDIDILDDVFLQWVAEGERVLGEGEVKLPDSRVGSHVNCVIHRDDRECTAPSGQSEDSVADGPDGDS